MKVTLLILGLILILNFDQVAFFKLKTEADQTFNYSKMSQYFYLRSFIYVIFGFTLCILVKNFRFNDIKMYRFHWKKVWPSLIPLVILLFIYSPLGYMSNMPVINWFYSFHPPIVSFEYSRSLFGTSIGFIIANGIRVIESYK